jgi:hypothetical protein
MNARDKALAQQFRTEFAKSAQHALDFVRGLTVIDEQLFLLNKAFWGAPQSTVATVTLGHFLFDHRNDQDGKLTEQYCVLFSSLMQTQPTALSNTLNDLVIYFANQFKKYSPANLTRYTTKLFHIVNNVPLQEEQYALIAKLQPADEKSGLMYDYDPKERVINHIGETTSLFDGELACERATDKTTPLGKFFWQQRKLIPFLPGQHPSLYSGTLAFLQMHQFTMEELRHRCIRRLRRGKPLTKEHSAHDDDEHEHHYFEFLFQSLLHHKIAEKDKPILVYSLLAYLKIYRAKKGEPTGILSEGKSLMQAIVSIQDPTQRWALLLRTLNEHLLPSNTDEFIIQLLISDRNPANFFVYLTGNFPLHKAINYLYGALQQNGHPLNNLVVQSSDLKDCIEILLTMSHNDCALAAKKAFDRKISHPPINQTETYELASVLITRSLVIANYKEPSTEACAKVVASIINKLIIDEQSSTTPPFVIELLNMTGYENKTVLDALAHYAPIESKKILEKVEMDHAIQEKLIANIPLSDDEVEVFITKKDTLKKFTDLCYNNDRDQTRDYYYPAPLSLEDGNYIKDYLRLLLRIPTVKGKEILDQNNFVVIGDLLATTNDSLLLFNLAKSGLLEQRQYFNLVKDRVISLRGYLPRLFSLPPTERTYNNPKRMVLEEIKKLPDEQRRTALEDALDQTKPLGKFFWTQRGEDEPIKTRGSLKKISGLLAAMNKCDDINTDLEMTERSSATPR